MFLLITLSAIFIAYAFLKIILRRAEKRRYREYKNASRVGSGTSWGTASIILFPTAAIVLAIFELFDYSIIALLVALAINLFQFGCEGLRVYYNDNELLYKRYFGKYTKIHFKDVTKFSVRKDLIIEASTKTIRIQAFLVDWDPILTRLGGEKMINSRHKKYTRVRCLKDSVSDLRPFCAGLVAFFLVGSVGIFSLILGIKSDTVGKGIGIVVSAVMIIIGCCGIPLSIISVKRHHSSVFWDSVARFLVSEIYLIPCVRNINKMIWHLNKGRCVHFLFNSKEYVIQPTGNESQALEKELVLMHDQKQLFKGTSEEIVSYEFEPGASIKNSFKEIDVTHIFKNLHWAITLS